MNILYQQDFILGDFFQQYEDLWIIFRQCSEGGGCWSGRYFPSMNRWVKPEAYPCLVVSFFSLGKTKYEAYASHQ